MKLDFILSPTYDVRTFNVVDASIYDNDPPQVTNPLLEVDVPGFDTISLAFSPKTYNLLDSTKLGITETGSDPLPDGIYTFKYTVSPDFINVVEKNYMRIDALQEKFDEAFMRLDMMQCDQAIKRQEKLQLNSIYYFIQGSVSSANNCSLDQALQLYNKAAKMLRNFNNKSVCCGNNLINNPY